MARAKKHFDEAIKKKNIKQYPLRMPETMLDELRAAAKKRGVSQNEFCRLAIDFYIKKLG